MPTLSKRAAALLEQFPGPVTIRSARWFYPLSFTLFAITIAIAFRPVWSTWPRILHSREAIGWALALLLMLGIPLVALVISLLKGLPYAVLDAKGVAFDALLISFRRPWSQVDRFSSYVIYIGLSDLVRPGGFWDKMNSFGNSSRRFVPATLALRPKELAQLLTAWRERALAAEQGAYGSSSVSQ